MNGSDWWSRFEFGDKVIIDADASIIATVIGFCFYPHGTQIRCGWFTNGIAQSDWVDDFRLTLKERPSAPHA